MSDNETQVTVLCGHCLGTGRKAAPALTATLELLRRQKNWRSGDDLARALNVNATAMCNRLADLFRLGHVERKGAGTRHSPYEWRAK